MLLGAFLDAGAPARALEAAIEALGLKESVEVRVSEKIVGELPARYVEVDVTSPQAWSTVSAIDSLIRLAALDDGVKERSRLSFRLLAEAEARAHGVPIDRVRLHEAGAVDAVIDVVGTFALADAMEVEAFYCSALPLCRGTTTSEHGEIPLPAPATMNILEAVGAPTYFREGDAELVTPTGAAIIGACATFESPKLWVRREGRGAGSHELPWPNVLRVVIGEVLRPASPTAPPVPAAAPQLVPVAHAVPSSVDGEADAVEWAPDHVEVIETNIDDMAPNLLAEIPRLLLDAGALDAFLTPVIMKKGRPAHLLTVVCDPAHTAALAERIIRETSTLGVRVRSERRLVAGRRFVVMRSSLGDVSIKLKEVDGRILEAAPEFEDVRRLAELQGVAVADAHRQILAEARREFIELSQ